MALYSTLPAVETALVAALVAQPALSGIQVAETHPGDAQQGACIYLGDAKATEIVPTMRAARTQRQEDYVLDVWVDCVTSGPNAGPAVTQSYVLAGALEDALSANATLGVNGVLYAFIGSWETRKGFDDKRLGWACQIRIGVHVTARLN